MDVMRLLAALAVTYHLATKCACMALTMYTLIPTVYRAVQIRELIIGFIPLRTCACMSRVRPNLKSSNTLTGAAVLIYPRSTP